MKKSFLILAAALLVIFSLGSCSRKEQPKAGKSVPPDHEKMVEGMKKDLAKSEKVIVARVDKDTITMNDLIREMNMIGPKYVKPGGHSTPEINAAVRKEALDILIFRKLAVQEAKRQGMKVSQQVVDDAVRKFKARAGSDKAYEAYLVSQALTEAQFKKLIAEDNLFRQITKKEIFRKAEDVKPDEKQLKEIYTREKKSFVMPEAYNAEDLFFVGGKKDEKTMEKAKKVLAGIKAGGNDFSRLASDGSFVIRKIPVTRNMFPNIYDSLSGMKSGDVSGIIQERDGLHIVKAGSKSPARIMTFKEAKHIIGQRLMNQAIEKRKEEWEKGLKKSAKIEVTLKKGEGIKALF
jgi:parvulin-like peptidyl-prolyl isomerase